MVDLSAEMAELWASLGAPAAGRARVVQIAAARRGEGVSSVARDLALFAARRANRSVWLVDADLLGQGQHGVIDREPDRFGRLGPAVAASPDGSMFFTVRPTMKAADGRPLPDAGFLTGHRVGEARLWVTRFRRERLQNRQSVHIMPDPAYWRALRQHADLIVVDAPSADRSRAAVTLSPLMDQTVLVVASDEADIRAPAALRDAMAAAGGTVSGLFFNRATVKTPSFLRSILP